MRSLKILILQLSIKTLTISICPKIPVNVNISYYYLYWNIFRNRLGVIPQDPFIFHGPVKVNLDPDPTSDHSEMELWSALKSASIADTIKALGGLDAVIKPQSMSVGQRQLLCIARAILHRPKVILKKNVLLLFQYIFF